MCGICGEWNAAGADGLALAAMNDALSHRGPDDAGVERFATVGLAMRRLSIIDLASGHQPVANEDGTCWIVCNGEIYNYRELRAGLERRGHRFRTASDVEVVLHLYEERGVSVVDELRGMFAFAVWDSRLSRLLLARDRFGQKPLFYRQTPDRLLFASEIKAILAALPGPPEPNLDALDDYLTLRYVPSPDTMFRGIHKLPPAHVLIFDVPRGPGERPAAPEIRRYWTLSYLPKMRLSESDAVACVEEQLREAVESHLVADVPVGALLSGGLDSSIVVALMAQAVDRPPATFAIGVREQDFDELPHARRVAEHCATEHHEEVVWPDLVSLLPTMVWHLDEPSDPIAACMFHAAALAARHRKVILTGDGGDEAFAGFDRYRGFGLVRLYAALPAVVRRGVLRPILRRLPDRAGYKNLTQRARWVHELSFHRGGRRYAEATAFFRFGEDGKRGLYTPATAAALAGRDATAGIVEAFDDAWAEDDLDRMLWADVATRLPEHSLQLTDRMTMAHGLEARAPLLDHDLAGLVACLPAALKLRRGRLKHVLRRVAERHLPPEIVRRPKQGFMFPLGYWIKGPLEPVLRAWIDDSALVRAGIFRREALSRLLDEHLADRADHHVRLWMFLNVEVWFRMYQLGQSADGVRTQLERHAPREAAGR
jgi:asparagine synthase (glutamine-hydrolysing)